MARYGGRRAQAFTRLVLATYGDECHLCHHPGADSADHLVPRSKGGPLYAIGNARPAHHRPCPLCGLCCNSRRGNRSVASATPPNVDTLGYVD